MKHLLTLLIFALVSLQATATTTDPVKTPELGIPAASLTIGIGLASQGRHEEAIESYDSALKINPVDGDALFYKGLSLYALQRYPKALSAFDAVLKNNPHDSGALLNKGTCLFAMGRHDKTIAVYDTLLKINPEHFEAHYNKGNSLVALKRYEEALVSYDTALKIQPDYLSALNNKGLSLLNMQRYDEAIAVYDTLPQINPDYSIYSFYNKASAYALMKNKEEMLSNLTKAIRLNASLREFVREDPFFKNYLRDPDFRKLVGLE